MMESILHTGHVRYKVMIKNLMKLLDDHQIYHSDFQMDNFITIRSGETQYGQYKQALRELFKRYRGLKELYTGRELLQVDIDELNEKHSDNDFEIRRTNINLAKHRMDMEDLDPGRPVPTIRLLLEQWRDFIAGSSYHI